MRNQAVRAVIKERIAERYKARAPERRRRAKARLRRVLLQIPIPPVPAFDIQADIEEEYAMLNALNLNAKFGWGSQGCD